MKRFIALVAGFFITLTSVFSQTFSDNFESYTVNSYIGPQSKLWTTWNLADGTPEDSYVVKTNSASGSQSIYFYSAKGGGPQDVVFPFGGPYTSGRFKFTANFFVSNSSAAYFNFQGGSTTGVSWPIEFYMFDNGTFSVGSLFGNYPQGKWFEIKIDIDLTNNKWEVFFDNVSQGSWANSINSVSFINIFDSDPNTEFWIDDLSYCVNNDCNPDLSLEKLTINPNPVCTNHNADVIVKIKNNGPMVATEMNLDIEMAGQNPISKLLNLNKLGVGKDTTIAISGLFKTNISGTFKINAVNMSKDPQAANDTAKISLSVFASPSGSTVIKGTVFDGEFKAGIPNQPDLLEINKTNNYELTPPKGYTNNTFGSAWLISSLIVKTSKGKTVPSTAYSLTPPNTSSGANGFISFTGSKTYLDSTLIFSVTLMVKATGCDSSLSRVLRIVPTPRPNFSFTNPVCDGTPVIFYNHSTIHSGDLIYLWYFGDGDSSNAEVIAHVYPSFGTYCVKLVAISLPYYIRHDTTLCVTISEIPKVVFKVVNACEGQDISFLNQTTIGTGTMTYDWRFGDGTPNSSLSNPSHQYNLAGGYKVTLSVKSNNGCTNSLTKNANQFLKPKADFSTSGFCSKSVTEFTNLTTIGAGDAFGNKWNFGDGTGNNERNPAHVFTSAGVKSVKYIATSQFGCKDSIVKNITIIQSPDADFTTGQVCNIDPVVFNNTSIEPAGVLVNYLWDFGDGKTSIIKNPNHNYPDLGTRVVSLLANGDNGCSTSVTKTIKVLVQPLANFVVADVCAGSEAIFINKSKSSGQVTYKWKFGDGDSSSMFFPVKKYKSTVATTYNVTLTASVLGGCKNSYTSALTVNENPKCGYTYSSTGTGGYEYMFKPNINSYPFYQWSFEGGGISNTNPAFHTWEHDGKYRVRVVMRTPDGCECIDSSQFITINHLGVKRVKPISGITFFPNPNSGIFNIQVSSISPTEPFTLNILDLAGRVVYTSTLIGNAKHEVVNNELSNGLYTLEIVRQSGERATAKMNVVK